MLNITKYRLYPEEKEEQMLFRSLELCTFVRNTFLDSNCTNVRWLPELKKEMPELKEVHSVVLQNVVFQIRDNKKTLKALVKKGYKTGKMRLKFQRSMIYEVTGFRLDTERQEIWLSKIGTVPIVLSRPVIGTIKQIVVKRRRKGEWFASIISDDGEPLPDPVPIQKVVGIDMNLTNFSTDSDGLVIENPRFYRKKQDRLGRLNKKLSRCEKGSKRWSKAKRLLGRQHDQIEDCRNDFLQKVSTYYVNNYDLICVEDLKIRNMVRTGGGRAKSIYDAGWGTFFGNMEYKAENAGKQVVRDEPAYTSMDCCFCKNRLTTLTLKDRTYCCPACGSELPRDLNASFNIRDRGLAKVGLGKPEPAIWVPDRKSLGEIRISTVELLASLQQVRIDESRAIQNVLESHAL